MCNEIMGLGILIVLQGIAILSLRKEIRNNNLETSEKLDRVIDGLERLNRSCSKINETTLRISNDTSTISYDLKKK